MSAEKVRVGLVGAGAISAVHLPRLLKLDAEVLVYSEKGAEELTETFGGECVSTLDELLARVDVVDIVTPTFTHAHLLELVLNAAKDVIVEKPLARTSAEATQIIALAESLGQRILPAHVVRFFPEYVKLADAIRLGRLGELAVLKFERASARPSHAAWFEDGELSGGLILDQMIHDLDFARWVAGDVNLVSAVSNSRIEGGAKVESAHVLLQHRSGAITHVAGLWGPPHLQFATSFSVAGTKGTLSHSSGQQLQVRSGPSDEVGGGGELMPAVDPANDPYLLELEEFLQALAGGRPARVDARDGASAVALATAALRSLETGQPVRLDQENFEL